MLTVESGAPFDVELGSGPSTGYTWQLQSLPEGILLLGSDFVPVPEARIGDGGMQVFHLAPQRPGRFSLLFVRKRKWETEPIETRLIDVDVR
jgi:predicted secreted protein